MFLSERLLVEGLRMNCKNTSDDLFFFHLLPSTPHNLSNSLACGQIAEKTNYQILDPRAVFCPN